MPNKSEHLKVAATAGFILGSISALLKNKNQTDFASLISDVITEGIATAMATSIGALLPDILEPATNPNHRKFFHSIAMFLGLSYDQLQQMRQDAGSNEEFWRWLLNKLELGYLIHLLQDSGTPKGLPLI